MQLFGTSTATLSRVNQLLRIMAHFVGFLILGGVVSITAQMTWPNQRYNAVMVVVLCSVIAVLDEVKKIFISGRHLSWPEAGLNVLGIICGVSLSLVILWLAERREARH